MLASRADSTRGPASSDSEMEARRLAEAVRLLAADRDRLLARLTALERNFGEVTGSISAPLPRSTAPANPADSALPPMLAPGPAPPTAAAPATPQAQPAIAPRPAQPQPQPGPVTTNPPPRPAETDRSAQPSAAADPGPTGSVATKTEFGVELGTATSVEGLRALWGSVKGDNEALLEGLRPVMSIREGTRPGTFELRLVAGPLSNAGAAARLCAVLAVAIPTCQPVIFDGQRLALK
jgi:hypothetical protein